MVKVPALCERAALIGAGDDMIGRDGTGRGEVRGSGGGGGILSETLGVRPGGADTHFPPEQRVPMRLSHGWYGT